MAHDFPPVPAFGANAGIVCALCGNAEGKGLRMLQTKRLSDWRLKLIVRLQNHFPTVTATLGSDYPGVGRCSFSFFILHAAISVTIRGND